MKLDSDNAVPLRKMYLVNCNLMFQSIKAYYLNLIPHLSEADWTTLEQKLKVRKLHKGDFLIKAGYVCKYVSFINSGLLRFYYSVDGKDISIGFARTGDYISEYESFLLRKPATQNIEALIDCEVIDLAYQDIQTLYKQHSEFQEFGRKIAESLFIMLNQRNTALLVMSPEERYRNMIESHPQLLQVVPQYMLASYIGITPEHLSRIRKKIAAK